MLNFIDALAFLSSIMNLSTTSDALALGGGLTEGSGILIGLGLGGVGLVAGSVSGLGIG